MSSFTNLQCCVMFRDIAAVHCKTLCSCFRYCTHVELRYGAWHVRTFITSDTRVPHGTRRYTSLPLLPFLPAPEDRSKANTRQDKTRLSSQMRRKNGHKRPESVEKHPMKPYITKDTRKKNATPRMQAPPTSIVHTQNIFTVPYRA